MKAPGIIKDRSEKLSALLEENVPKNYRYGCRNLKRFLEEKGYGLSFDALEAYGRYLREEHGGRRYASRTINNYLAAAVERVRYVVSHADTKMTLAQSYALEKALKEIKKEKIQTVAVTSDRILTYAEIRRLIAECPDRTTALFIEFLSYTALRISEACGILLSDLKKYKDHYSVRIAGKGHKERWIMAELSLVDRIASHFAGEKYLFEHNRRRYRREHISMAIKRQGRRILDRDISAHTLRHSWATYACKKTQNYKAVQTQLGHSSPSITLSLYVHDSFDWPQISKLFKEP